MPDFGEMKSINYRILCNMPFVAVLLAQDYNKLMSFSFVFLCGCIIVQIVNCLYQIKFQFFKNSWRIVIASIPLPYKWKIMKLTNVVVKTAWCVYGFLHRADRTFFWLRMFAPPASYFTWIPRKTSPFYLDAFILKQRKVYTVVCFISLKVKHHMFT